MNVSYLSVVCFLSVIGQYQNGTTYNFSILERKDLVGVFDCEKTVLIREIDVLGGIWWSDLLRNKHDLVW